jgi:hypothetical protein
MPREAAAGQQAEAGSPSPPGTLAPPHTFQAASAGKWIRTATVLLYRGIGEPPPLYADQGDHAAPVAQQWGMAGEDGGRLLHQTAAFRAMINLWGNQVVRIFHDYCTRGCSCLQ